MSDVHTNYKEYLESYAWKALKMTKLEEQPQCECCGAPATSVHHLSYERLGREKPEDIVSICERCHDECHHVGGYQIKNDEETLRRRYEEVRNTYLGNNEPEEIELTEIFKYNFSQEKISTFIHSYTGQGIINGKNYTTLQLRQGKKNILLDDTNISSNSINKLGLIWDNPYFKADNGLYYAYKINFYDSDNYESIPESEINRYYLLKLSCFDKDTFEVISGFVVKDKYGIYLVKYLFEVNGEGAIELTIYKSDICVNGFIYLGGSYCKNKTNIYFIDHASKSFIDSYFGDILKVKGADLDTFETLDDGRAKDKNYIYDYGKIIEHIIYENEDNDYGIGDNGGCSYGEYGEDCKILFSDRSDWCSNCRNG